jgi:(4S)-4-hydroxy-5-phosphonooxypentane-2,3-dione isomerase
MSMEVVIVHIKVKEGRAKDFVAATLENRGHSLREPGVARFDLLADKEDPCRFVLIEGYRDAAALAAHKETAHYKKWRDLAEPMMAEPRTRAFYAELGQAELGTEARP